MVDRTAMSELLVAGCQELELDLKEAQAAQFLDYFDLVQEWNQKINLTAIVDERQFMIKHCIDSLAGASFLGPRGRLVDIGSGAGLPGLALKIFYPQLEVCLVESLGKKARFIETAAAALGLKGVEVVCSRAEEIGQEPAFRENFDFAVCRAVSELAVITEYCLPLVKTGGCFVAYKGDKAEEELSRAELAISTLGGTLEAIHKVTLPLLGDGRTLISLRKTSATPVKYPRRPGLPTKQPLM